MPCFTYILFSTRLNLFYVGVTNNIEKRLIEHNKFASCFTSTGVPWTLLWSTSKTDRKSAERLESRLKNLTRKRKIEFMIKYKDGISQELSIKILNQLM
ncbi:MAG: GIY-YIG nuclease family protein [Bacteroidia bacterium]|nr:GIY-YIG nuclease family protein [Bacteroidia bacterium]